MADPLKYAVVERERRFLVRGLPNGTARRHTIVDRYVDGTRLRLREVRDADGSVTRKLTHKVRLSDGPGEIACTNFYLDESEWQTLSRLASRTIAKTRYVFERDGVRVAVDEHADGTFVAEIDDGGTPSTAVPAWLDVVEDVSTDERWTGAEMAV
jgi:CYTH domain-containing protein